jgi:Tol biopolymer transport system component
MKPRYVTSLAGIAVLLGLGVMLVHPTAAEQRFSDWSLPVNLGPLVNSAFNDLAPHISKNGLSLYFASTRPGTVGGEDIWVSQRPNRNAPWGPPINLGLINTPSNERSPALSRDGHFLFFATDRPGGFGGLDIWVSWRAHTHDDFAWQAPVNLGDVINTAATDAGPSFFESDDTGMPQLFMASNRPSGLGFFDIYVSTMNGAGFGPPMLLQELSSPLVDLTPTIRHDGLEIIIASNRPGTPGFPATDLWVATRQTVLDSWSAPALVGPLVNTEFVEFFPSLSSDGHSLFFTSNRPDGFGGFDLWMSTRVRTP